MNTHKQETMTETSEIKRGNKYSTYTERTSIDKEYYEGDIWNAKEGEKLIGKYIDVLHDVGKYKQNMYIIDTDRIDKKYDKIFGCTTLDRQMKEVHINDILEIKYEGQKGNKNYHEFKVSILKKEVK